MTKQVELITYANSCDKIDFAVSCGITHIILNDAQLSIRSFEDYTDDDSFSHLLRLITHCRRKHPYLILSIQCDMLFHHTKDTLIKQFVTAIQSQDIDYIRVQDIGLLHYFSEVLPQTKLIFLSEMSNNNWRSIEAIASKAQRQTLNMELPHTSIKAIQDKVNTDFECVVQGPILIQYSHRRFMAGLNPDISNPEQKESIHRLAQDEDYPGRRFSFLDNPHGHFMFAYFDRCLLSCAPLLTNLHLSGWIIDDRGESDDYLKQACILYKHALTQHSAIDISPLEEVATRPQKPGFFKANQTDRRRYKSNFMTDITGFEKVAQILDAEKDKRISFECQRPIKRGDELHAFHPKIDSCSLVIDALWDMAGNKVSEGKPGQVLQIPYIKGIQQQAIFAKKR